MEAVRQLCTDIVRLVHPKKIILFNQKTDVHGALSSFKLCVVAEGNPAELEGRIYLGTDCPVHFDVLVYSCADFEKFSADPTSFAHRIVKTGSVLHG